MPKDDWLVHQTQTWYSQRYWSWTGGNCCLPTLYPHDFFIASGLLCTLESFTPKKSSHIQGGKCANCSLFHFPLRETTLHSTTCTWWNQVEFLQIVGPGKELEFATMVAENNDYFFDWVVTYADTKGVQIFSCKVHRIILVSSRWHQTLPFITIVSKSLLTLVINYVYFFFCFDVLWLPSCPLKTLLERGPFK